MRNEHLKRAIEIMKGSIETPVPPSLIAEPLGFQPASWSDFSGDI